MENNYEEIRRKDKRKRSKMLIFALVAVLLISIGYATLATMLGIKGASITVNKDVWKVFFVRVDDNKPNNLTPSSPPTISNDKKEIIFGVNLQSIGDKYVFDADIQNQSSFDALLDQKPTLVLKRGSEVVALPRYLGYSVVDSTGNELDTGFEIAAGATKTITITVEYLEVDELPDDDYSFNLSYSMHYVSK